MTKEQVLESKTRKELAARGHKMKYYKVTYCQNVETHEYGYKLFETREKAVQWCRDHIGVGMGISKIYREIISEVEIADLMKL